MAERLKQAATAHLSERILKASLSREVLMKYVLAFCLALNAFAVVFGQDEQSPIVEKDIAYKDWTLKTVRELNEVHLRDLLKDRKLAVIVYFAPWCHNWQHDAPILQRLYDKYKNSGFEIIAVGEYAPVDDMIINLDTLKVTFPAVYETQMRAAVDTSMHNTYRRITGDTRQWGSPYYVFIEPASVTKKGDILLSRTNVINGEMIEAESERFIRQKLGLPPEILKLTSQERKVVEVCDPAKTTSLKKPAGKP